MIDQLHATLSEKCKAHALTIVAARAAESVVADATAAQGRAISARAAAHEEVRDALHAITEFHYGEIK